MAVYGRHILFFGDYMNTKNDVIESILTLYCLTGYGKGIPYYDSMKNGLFSLLNEFGIPGEYGNRIWGIISNIYNQELNDTLPEDALVCLKKELEDYFDLTHIIDLIK